MLYCIQAWVNAVEHLLKDLKIDVPYSTQMNLKCQDVLKKLLRATFAKLLG